MLRRDDAPDPAAPSLDAGSLPDAAGLAGPAGASAAPDVETHNRVGSARYIRTSLALFLAGFATFSLLYCPQPLLPTLSRAFGVDAAAASLVHLGLHRGSGALHRGGRDPVRPQGPQSRHDAVAASAPRR